MRRMRRVFRGGAVLLWLGPVIVQAAGPVTPAVSTPTISTASLTTPQEPAEPDQPFSADEGEAAADDHLIPTAAYTAKKPYDQARDALQRAEEFWKQKQALKTSDAALEAYDDLMEVRVSRRAHKARRKLQAERHRAAEIYVAASILYIKEEAKRQGMTAAAKQEARDRLGDLRDVSREYLELQKQVVNAIMELQ